MRIVVTGCSSGLGLLTARRLVDNGHDVIPHVRNPDAAEALISFLPGLSTVFVADLTRHDQVEELAKTIGDDRAIDVVIHNAGLGDRLTTRTMTGRLADLFAVNVVAPYIITALNPDIPRWVFVSSALHRDATIRLEDASWDKRAWNPRAAYAESKLLLTVLAQAAARLRPLVESNSIEPGWVPTRMGGPGAPDDLGEGVATQVWLATSAVEDGRSGGHYYHRRPAAISRYASDNSVQDEMLVHLRELTHFPFSVG